MYNEPPNFLFLHYADKLSSNKWDSHNTFILKKRLKVKNVIVFLNYYQILPCLYHKVTFL